jgi:TPR repeat protein
MQEVEANEAYALFKSALEALNTNPLLAIMFLYQAHCLGHKLARARLFQSMVTIADDPTVEIIQEKDTLKLFYLYLQAYSGLGVPRNTLLATKYAEEIEARGPSFARNSLHATHIGSFSNTPLPDDLIQLQTLAEEGNIAAQCRLGELNLHGEIVERNYVAAIHWLEKAAHGKKREYYAECLDPEKLYLLPDYVAAFEQILKDTPYDGYPYAKYLLGKLYLAGEYVAQNRDTTLFLFQHVIEAGYSPLQFAVEHKHLEIIQFFESKAKFAATLCRDALHDETSSHLENMPHTTFVRLVEFLPEEDCRALSLTNHFLLRRSYDKQTQLGKTFLMWKAVGEVKEENAVYSPNSKPKSP